MQIRYDAWKRGLAEFSSSINGYLTITKNPSFGFGGHYLSGSIIFSYHYKKIIITQNVIEDNFENCFPSFLQLEYSYSNPNNLNITLNQRDFFDWFLSRNIISGNKAFDKKFTIGSSDSKLALLVFKEERVQKLFLENPLLIFNVRTEKKETAIKIRSLAQKFYIKEEMLFYLEEFKFILNKILK